MTNRRPTKTASQSGSCWRHCKLNSMPSACWVGQVLSKQVSMAYQSLIYFFFSKFFSSFTVHTWNTHQTPHTPSIRPPPPAFDSVQASLDLLRAALLGLLGRLGHMPRPSSAARRVVPVPSGRPGPWWPWRDSPSQEIPRVDRRGRLQLLSLVTH